MFPQRALERTINALRGDAAIGEVFKVAVGLARKIASDFPRRFIMANISRFDPFGSMKQLEVQ